MNDELFFDMGAWFPSENDPASYSFFSEHYYEAAVELGKIAVHKCDKFYAIPLLYLIRHAVELQLESIDFGYLSFHYEKLCPVE